MSALFPHSISAFKIKASMAIRMGIVLACHIPAGAFAAAVIEESFVAAYSNPRTQAFAQLSDGLRRARTLEKLAALLSEAIDIPDEPVTLTFSECGNPNAFYNSAQRTVVLCFEFVQQMAEGMQGDFARIATPQEINESIGGGIAFVLMHELGHALIHLLDIPVLGREEDAADQIAGYLVLQAGDGATYALAGALWSFRSKTLFYSRRHFSDEHSLGPQRQSNLACLAIGKDPTKFQYLLVGGFITRERAVRCPEEYRLLDSSVRRLLGAHLLPRI